ncbi:DUF362 domain-containing protein [Candidatus Bathyarchaeota archaeon]|nr:DUF362 domain-containing protein [Candidatus Bathyarchaeota archaeon]
MKSKVSLVKSEEHYKGVQDTLLNIKEDIVNSLSNISSLVIKVNIVVAKTKGYPKGVELATTPIGAVKSFIDFISPFYKKEIIIAERSAWGITKEGFELHGFTKLAQENMQVKLLDLKDDPIIEKTITYPKGKLVLPFSKTMLEAPFLVSIVRPKTHCDVRFTAAIKNVLVGGINGSWECRLQIHKGEYVHNILTSIADLIYPHLTIIDGTIAMEGNGPIMGNKNKAGWSLSSFDALAADTLAVHLMEFNVNDIKYLKMLKEKKVGLCFPDKKIEILGEKPKTLISAFKPHHKFRKKAINKTEIKQQKNYTKEVDNLQDFKKKSRFKKR